MAYLAILSLSEGRRVALYAVAGVALGLLTVGIGASLGLAALIENSAVAYQILRWSGVFYLLWLAWDTWSGEKITPQQRADKIASKRKKFFERGLITNLLNPKAAIFYVTILPGFIVNSSSIIAQNIGLTVTYVLVATTIHILIVMLAGSMEPLLNKPEKIIHLRRFLSILLIGVAIWLGVSTSRGISGE